MNDLLMAHEFGPFGWLVIGVPSAWLLFAAYWMGEEAGARKYGPTFEERRAEEDKREEDKRRGL